MIILQIAAYYAEFSGNFINALLELDKKVYSKENKMIYAFPNEAKQREWCVELQKRRKVYFLPLKNARLNVKTYKMIRRICILEKVDIIHSHFELYDIPSLFCSSRTKIIWHVHDALDAEKKGIKKTIRKVQYKFFSKRVYIITISEYDKQKLISKGVRNNCIKVIPNGIRTDCLKNIDIQKNKPVFLTMGWDFERKGVDLILQASKRLKDEHYDFEVIINCRFQTINLIKKYVDIEKEKWLFIQYPKVHIEDIYKDANIFIQASRYETFSFAVCEAAYAGLKVIISDIDGLAWAKDLKYVSVFKNENVNELYEKMKEHIISFNKNKNLENIRYNRILIDNNYSTYRWVEDILQFYERIR